MDFTTDTPVNESGAFDANGFSLWFGFGKVNAFHAVQAASAAVAAERAIDIQADANLPIPDVGEPIISSIDIDEEGTVTELRIQVNISHTYIGDLRVDLIAPDNSVVVLHNKAGCDGQHNPYILSSRHTCPSASARQTHTREVAAPGEELFGSTWAD